MEIGLQVDLAALLALAGDLETAEVLGSLEVAIEADSGDELRTIENGAAEDVDGNTLRHIGACRDNAEEIDVELVDGHRGHGIGECDGLELDVAALLLEVAKLIGENGRGNLDELAGDGAYQMLAIALFHEIVVAVLA